MVGQNKQKMMRSRILRYLEIARRLKEKSDFFSWIVWTVKEDDTEANRRPRAVEKGRIRAIRHIRALVESLPTNDEGLTYLGNVAVYDEEVMKQRPSDPLDKPTSRQLREAYEQAFREVKLEQALDSDGQPLPMTQFRVVYVKV